MPSVPSVVKIFAKRSDFDGVQCKEDIDKKLCCFFFAIFAFSCGQFKWLRVCRAGQSVVHFLWLRRAALCPPVPKFLVRAHQRPSAGIGLFFSGNALVSAGRATLCRAETRFPGKKSRLDRVSHYLSPPSLTHYLFRHFSLDNLRLYANLPGVRTRQVWRNGGGAERGVDPIADCGFNAKARSGQAARGSTGNLPVPARQLAWQRFRAGRPKPQASRLCYPLRWIVHAGRGRAGRRQRRLQRRRMPRPASNHSVPYLFSMLYDFVAASMIFSAKLTVFDRNVCK